MEKLILSINERFFDTKFLIFTLILLTLIISVEIVIKAICESKYKNFYKNINTTLHRLLFFCMRPLPFILEMLGLFCYWAYSYDTENFSRYLLFTILLSLLYVYITYIYYKKYFLYYKS